MHVGGGRFRRGEGIPPYARVLSGGRRAASPLAAVAVCGGGRVPGRDESLPYELNRKRGYYGKLRAGHARPLQGGDGETGYGGKLRAGHARPLQDAQFFSGIFGWLYGIFHKDEQNMSPPS